MGKDMMLHIWAIIGPILGAAVGYAIKKIFDWRFERISVPDIELQKKKLESQFSVTVNMLGALAHIDHCMWHIQKGDVGYIESIQKWYAEIRSQSRSSLALIGKELVTEIREVTDLIPLYNSTRSEGVYEKWKTKLENLQAHLNKRIREIGKD